MKQDAKKSEIKVKLMLLSNYITYGDFEMTKGIMQQILSEDKQYLWSLIDSILKKSLVSLL
jgi:hypothetical protein